MSKSGKLNKLFQAINAIVKKPYLLNHVLQSDEYWQSQLEQDFPQFKKGLPQLPLDSLLTEKGSSLDLIAFLGGGSMITDLALLKSLASRIPDCKYFEIGTWRGESVANVASVASKCVTLNLSSQQMKDRGWSEEYAHQHAYFSKKIEHVEHVFGDSKSFDFYQLKSTFDLIFIDGDHTQDYVVNDTQKVVSNLMHANSVVVWHDYARSPEQFRPEVLHGILTGLDPNSHSRLFHVSNSLCAILLPDSPLWSKESAIPASTELARPKRTWVVQIGK